jgi:thioredoxin 1
MATKIVTDQSFAAEVLNSDKPVLLDFWAEWCGPCRMIAPALEEISAALGEQVTVAKINIDENPETPGKYGVRGIPTMLLFKNGEVAAQKVGAAPRGQIQSWLEAQLS